MIKKALLLTFTPLSLISTLGYAAQNPASTDYVDLRVKELQTQIASIPQGPQGPQGLQGPQGPQGPAGQGVPPGGTIGQVLAKASNNNFATQWVNSSSLQYAIGQAALGGVIYYVYIDSSGNQHGLVAAPTDEPGGAAYTWGSSITPGTAQHQCANETIGGYNDWLVPNQAQMTALYNNRYAIDPTDPNGNGGFNNATMGNTQGYWTSIASDAPNQAWGQAFGDGFQRSVPEVTALSVRCIRTF